MLKIGVVLSTKASAKYFDGIFRLITTQLRRNCCIYVVFDLNNDKKDQHSPYLLCFNQIFLRDFIIGALINIRQKLRYGPTKLLQPFSQRDFTINFRVQYLDQAIGAIQIVRIEHDTRIYKRQKSGDKIIHNIIILFIPTACTVYP